MEGSLYRPLLDALWRAAYVIYIREARKTDQGDPSDQGPLLLYVRVEGVKGSDQQTLGNQIRQPNSHTTVYKQALTDDVKA